MVGERKRGKERGREGKREEERGRERKRGEERRREGKREEERGSERKRGEERGREGKGAEERGREWKEGTSSCTANESVHGSPWQHGLHINIGHVAMVKKNSCVIFGISQYRVLSVYMCRLG